MKTSLRLKPDLKWMARQRDLLDQVKIEVNRHLGQDPEDVRRYSSAYLAEFRSWNEATLDDLQDQMEKANIVFGGDFHAFAQAQRTHLRFLRFLAPKRKIVLALECFEIRAQKWLDLYLAGQLSLDGLRRETNWERRWGFPWENYVPLLELAKIYGFRLVGINKSMPRRSDNELHLRDQKSAKIICREMIKNPDALVYVIYGDLHLARKHLPLEVKQCLASFRARNRPVLRDLIVFLNSEKIYFDLASRGLELSVDVVRLGKNRYCVMSSPPWLQWQSYLLYLEKGLEAGLDSSGEGSHFDYTENVRVFVRHLAREFAIAVKADDFSVHSSEDKELWKILAKNMTTAELKSARYLLSTGKSFFIPNRIGCLSRATINQASTLAGQYLHLHLCSRDRSLWHLPQDFTALIWLEGVSYFFSKMINHKRKAHSLKDVEKQLQRSNEGDDPLVSSSEMHEALQIALDVRLSEILLLQTGKRRKLRVRPRHKESYLEAAKILGGMLGERLYVAYRSRKLKKKELLSWFRMDVTTRNFQKSYEKVLRELSYKISLLDGEA